MMPSMTAKDLGLRLRQARHRAGLSQRAAAIKAGMSHEYLCRLESGRFNVTMALLVRIARALDVPLDSLLQAPHPAAVSVVTEKNAISHRAVPAVRRRLAATLRTHREALGVTQWELGARAGLTGKFVSEVERGVKSISVDNLWHIYLALRHFGARDLLIADFFPPRVAEPEPQGEERTSMTTREEFPVGREEWNRYAGGPQTDEERHPEREERPEQEERPLTWQEVGEMYAIFRETYIWAADEDWPGAWPIPALNDRVEALLQRLGVRWAVPAWWPAPR
jgi:transcriptional regulator with XRE-family HTH domain